MYVSCILSSVWIIPGPLDLCAKNANWFGIRTQTSNNAVKTAEVLALVCGSSPRDD
ncbi:hypothetical protein NITHO_80002 [Nitrolancea hollandica Lb]|uniref:Uncharacterized protein n=1 Tax=Nitrolancea hollandica Lb TaxID=1129897 RepID=I4EN89_9BACT|nr:hypothetical protein NITHO_80002 [Nitrolancea hollandica Lb]